ncbi:MAG: hypothetical protein IJ877_02915 [Candidatus Gastranaerophilales bacterium]|nr:hypothetical protein [Candidatus Gastranaerophilales bacterium]
MSVVINTNVDSLKVQSTLTNATNSLSQSMQRMSSGLKINSAKDDAAGTVISARMQVQLDGNKICQNNVQNANAMMSTAEGNIDVVLDNMTRIRDLTLQAKNGTYSSTEIEAMQKEVKERIAEIDRVSASSKFSQLSLFEDATMQEHGVTFQIGQNADEGEKTDNIITANKDIFGSVKFSALTTQTGAFNLVSIKAGSGSYANFNTALTKLDTAIDNLTKRKSLIGSAQNRLDSALDTLTTQYTNLSSANSIITDADIASEASSFTQNQILQQVSTSLLAQANQSPSIALSLI